MRYIYNLQNTCIVKIKATGKPTKLFEDEKNKKNTTVITKKELFEHYNKCSRKNT